MDYKFANKINKIVEDKQQEKLIDEVINDIEKDFNETTTEFESDVAYNLVAAVAGVTIACLLIVWFVGLW